VKKKFRELPVTYETVLSVSGKFRVKLEAKGKNLIDDSTSLGGYKVIWGGEVIVDTTYSVPKVVLYLGPCYEE